MYVVGRLPIERRKIVYLTFGMIADRPSDLVAELRSIGTSNDDCGVEVLEMVQRISTLREGCDSHLNDSFTWADRRVTP